MRWLDLVHRWAGGLLGLILAVLGLTGALLVHKEDWIGLPHASDARIRDPLLLGQLTTRLLKDAKGGESLIFASDRFGLVQLRSGEGGLYASQAGDIVARWSSQWQRPELWLFDLHHHLFAGETGEFVAGLAGCAAVVFVVTGVLLWWRTRRTFRARLWPRRMTGPALRMHHRDLGIMVAPPLLLVALTGAMMTFRPVATVLLAPLDRTDPITSDLTPPRLHSSPLAPDPDWIAIITTAQRAFPDAELRLVALPRTPGDPIAIRLRQPQEWLPNGRTMLWFDAGSGNLLASRNARTLQPSTRAFNTLYPLHAGKVGGIAYRLLLTAVGVALFLLGVLSTLSFWFRRPDLPPASKRGAPVRPLLLEQ